MIIELVQKVPKKVAMASLSNFQEVFQWPPHSRALKHATALLIASRLLKRGKSDPFWTASNKTSSSFFNEKPAFYKK